MTEQIEPEHQATPPPDADDWTADEIAMAEYAKYLTEHPDEMERVFRDKIGTVL